MYFSKKTWHCDMCGRKRRGNAELSSEKLICWHCIFGLINRRFRMLLEQRNTDDRGKESSK